MRKTDFNEEDWSDLELLGAALESLQTGEFEVDSERVQVLDLARRGLEQIVRGEDVKVTYEMGEIIRTSGSVTVTGKNIIMSNPLLFAKIAACSSDLDIYPKTDGTVQMDFSFDGIARKVGD